MTSRTTVFAGTTYRIARIRGEAIDADLIETPEFEMPSYPICPGCEQETANELGWCIDCNCFAHEVRTIWVPLTEIEDLGDGKIAA